MDRTTVDKEQTQNLIRSVLAEIEDIINVSETYCATVTEEYEESNLHYLKVLSDMFGTDKENNGVGAQAEHLAALCTQADNALEEYFKKENSFSNTKMEGDSYGRKK